MQGGPEAAKQSPPSDYDLGLYNRLIRRHITSRTETLLVGRVGRAATLGA